MVITVLRAFASIRESKGDEIRSVRSNNTLDTHKSKCLAAFAICEPCSRTPRQIPRNHPQNEVVRLREFMVTTHSLLPHFFPQFNSTLTDSQGAGNNGTSPRPLSKVRTSFVTVEKGGQIGIRRDTSGEPSMAKRRTSFSIDEEADPKLGEERKHSLTEEIQVRKDSVAVTETIPEVAVEMEEDIREELPRGREPVRPKGQTKPADTKKDLPKIQEPVAPKKEAVTKPAEGRTLKAADTKVAQQATTTKKLESETKERSRTPAKPKVEPVKPTQSSQPSAIDESSKTPKSTPKPAPISVTKASTPVRAPRQKSPQKSKTPIPKTPTTPQPAKRSEKPTERAAHTDKEVPKEKKVPTPIKTRIGASPPQSGFTKPKPRSPTRPMKLPASLTAHTASSGSKFASSTTTLPVRSQSRASAASSTTKTLQRKPSTLNKATSGRPSLGPPPVRDAKKETPRTSLPASGGDDFLARMMRPTASSASKTAKAEAEAPPKKVLPKVKQVVKKVVAKVDLKKDDTTASNHAVKAPEQDKQQAKEIPQAEPVKTEEVVETLPEKAEPSKKEEIVEKVPENAVTEEEHPLEQESVQREDSQEEIPQSAATVSSLIASHPEPVKVPSPELEVKPEEEPVVSAIPTTEALSKTVDKTEHVEQAADVTIQDALPSEEVETQKKEKTEEDEEATADLVVEKEPVATTAE